ncbi:glycerol-3-phosphate ABC transporter permease [Alkalihalobacillus alcalophilus ATCC 27647 = CGMCC 1.3604]|uniref:Glycerol-3-phosphate ABC transporter permease n=1 Tax=Alkalihalobacillus alcalophilus ATCC 27647 = CGMCC 1.3604 TaxID=1218173 RepID=A0A094WM35_ALKAL|nr:sugar ABC transporter permease [Alkalihalobacillus alcalophilus]KGA97028.1 glycerol-3-phosphate ABC transporter permease [Alkalihalobacillus alcalophilus ATCC 27647 = CGMCC 1.3604]MED1563416.1 sugar ABC transporter permease [Alkalihalobacillus alcalophilus]
MNESHLKRKKRSLRDRTRNVRIAMLYLLPSLLLFSVFLFYPMIKTIYLSFFLTDPQGNAALFVGLENYLYLFELSRFQKSMVSTFLFVLYTVPSGVVLALFLALIANEKLRGIGFFRTLFSSTLGMSVAASSVIWLFLFHPTVGTLNHFLAFFNLNPVSWLLDPGWALISIAITTVWMNTGFSFLILLGGLQNIDRNLYESARIDGAGYFYQLFKVTIPMLSPTLFFIVTITFINSFQSFGQVDILTKGGPAESTNLIVYSIYQEAFINYQFGIASAQAVILFAIVLVLTLFQFKIGERKVHYQ